MKTFIYALLLSFSFQSSGLFAQADMPDFFDVQKIQDIRLTFENQNWAYLLDSLRYNGDEFLTARTLEVNGRKFEGVGVRIIDEHSFQPGSSRNGLYIQLNHSNPDYALNGHRVIELSSSLRDPSMVREVLGYEIARKYMPAPKANYANVWINGKRYGLYVNVEAVEGPFLAENFRSDSGPLFYSHPQMEKKLPTGCSPEIFGSLLEDKSLACLEWNFKKIQGQSHQPLQKFIQQLNKMAPADLKNILNEDHALWMLAFNNVMVNLSSYSGRNSPKYFLYQGPDGRFSPILWNLNLIFGGYKNTGKGSDLKLSELQQLDPLLHAENSAKPLIQKLLADPLNRKIYIAHMRTLLNYELVNGAYQTRARELQQLIRPDFVLDTNKTYTIVDFDQSINTTIGRVSKIPGIVELMDSRTRFLKRYPEMLIVPPSFSDLKYQTRERFSPNQVGDFRIQVKMSEFTRGVKVFYRFDAKGHFQEIAMADDGTSFDEQAGDNIFGVVIKPVGGARRLEYYLMAENAKAVSFLPELYVQTRQVITLDELNN